MAIARSVLMVELLMSADRVITAAQQAPAPDLDGPEWPPATIVGHLSMVDTEVWLPRIDTMVDALGTGQVPSFAWWEPDPVRTVAEFRGMTVDDAGARLLATRTALLHRLRELADEHWAASAEHDTWGTIDVEGLMLQVLAHDEEHRASIVLLEPEV